MNTFAVKMEDHEDRKILVRPTIPSERLCGQDLFIAWEYGATSAATAGTETGAVIKVLAGLLDRARPARWSINPDSTQKKGEEII